MARPRRKSERQALAVIVLFGIGLVAYFVSQHPWILAVPLLGAGVWFYVRFLHPYREANSDAARQAAEAARQAAQQAEAERVRRQELRERSLSLGGLLTLTPREFEHRVAEILEHHGYEDVEHVGRKGDLGIDLFATSPEGERVGVQCKRYAPEKLVRAPEVRLLYGDMTHANVSGLFVTTSGFTTDATAYADSHGIRLIDGKRLTRLLDAIAPELALDPRDRDSI